MSAFSLLILLAAGGFLYSFFCKKILEKTKKEAIDIANKKGVKIDFIFLWKKFALIIDHNNKNILLYGSALGEYRIVEWDDCLVDAGSHEMALKISVKSFKMESVYLFKGTVDEIYDLNRRLSHI